MIRHIAGNDIIETTRKRPGPGKEKELFYKLKYDTIRRHVELSQYKNHWGQDFLPEFQKYLKPKLRDLFVE